MGLLSDTRTRSGRAGTWPWLAALLALIFLAYQPALHGPFLFDDFPNLLHNPALRAFAAGTGPLWTVLADAHSGPLGRPISILTLALQARLQGFAPLPYKLFNLLVHALNAGLVFVLARQLLDMVPAPALPASRASIAAHQPLPVRPTAALALLAAALWALHPLALTPVLLVVQRMTSLATLGLLLGLWLSVLGRARLARGQSAGRHLWLGVPLAGVFALLSKETAVLFPVLLLAVDATLFAQLPLKEPEARHWRLFIRVFALLPVLLVLLALPFVLPGLDHGFAQRQFTLGQRLLTEGRVMWLYLRWLVLPQASQLGLYHDDIATSSDLWSPAATLPALLGLLVLASAALRWRRRLPWPAFAIAFFLASQLLESTVVPLELVFEHRVYLGMLGPILCAVLAAWELLARNRVPRPLVWVGAVVLLAGLSTWQRAQDWRDGLTFAQMEALHHPASVRAQYELANLYGDLAEGARQPEDQRRLYANAQAAALHAIAVGPREATPRIGLLVICALSGCVVPPETVPALVTILQSDHRTELLGNDLVNLAPCVARGECPIPVAVWRTLCDALAANPALTPRAAMMLADSRRWLAQAAAGAGTTRP